MKSFFYPINRFLVLVFFSILIPSCVNQHSLQCEEGLAPSQKVILYFGMSTPTGEIISEFEWKEFTDDSVTPHFPEGFTVLDSSGQWRDSSGEIISEPGKILIHLFDSSQDKQESIDSIIRNFKERFNAESVLKELAMSVQPFNRSLLSLFDKSSPEMRH